MSSIDGRADPARTLSSRSRQPNPDPPMTFDTFIATAWNDHGDRPREVADRLRPALPLIASAAQVPPFARLVTHVCGEHLGAWEEGIALLAAVRDLPVAAGDAEAKGALARGAATLRYAGGDAQALGGLTDADRIAALAGAASIFAGRGAFAAAIAAYREADAGAGNALPAGSPAVRALAVAGNNLAVALQEKPDRDAAETDGMVAAARGGLRYWRRAGTWLEEERAHHRLAHCLLAGGNPAAAADSAQDCITVCERNDAPAFEQFFGYAVLALARRATGDDLAFAAAREHALRLYARVPDDEREWCAADVTALANA